MDTQGYDTIIDGIRAEAEKAAADIRADAERQIAMQYASFEKQAARQLEDARQTGEARAAELARAARSNRRIAAKRQQLKHQEAIVQQLIEQVSRDLSQLVDDSAYPDILTEWIVEAGLGINLPAALVQCSAREAPLITASLLDRAVARIHDICGRHMQLSFDDTTPLPAQGPVLVSPDHTIAFSNQVPVRIQRFQSRIRHIIFALLFKEA